MPTSSTTTVARLNEDDLQNLDRRLNRSLAVRKSHIQRQIIQESSDVEWDVAALEALEGALKYQSSKKRRGLFDVDFGTSNAIERWASPVVGVQMAKKASVLTSLEQTADEIKANAKKGVRIAHQAESHPLIPLYRAAKIELPPQLKVDHEKLKYDFYAVEVTFSVLLPKNQFPLSAQLNLTLVDDATEPARRTRPIRLFPGRIDIQYFKADLAGNFGIDASMSFSTPRFTVPVNPHIKATGQASTTTEVKAAFVLGPLTYFFRKAALEVIGESDQQIIWRYNLKSQLTSTNEFKSILILKIAREVRSVAIDASLSVVPAKRHWLLFKNVLPALPAKVTLSVELV